MPDIFSQAFSDAGLLEPPEEEDVFASAFRDAGVSPAEFTTVSPVNEGLSFQQSGLVPGGDVPARLPEQQQYDPAMLTMARSYLDEQAAMREGRDYIAGSKMDSAFASTFRGIPPERRPEFLETLQYASSERVPDSTFDPVARLSSGAKSVAEMPLNVGRAMGLLSPEETAAIEFYNQAESIRRGTHQGERPVFEEGDSLAGKAGKLAREGLEGALEMAPAMYAGGQVGKLAGVATGALGGTASQAGTAAATTGTAFWSATEFPELYDSAREMGVDEGKARIAAVVAAPLVGYIERLQFGQMEAPLKKMFKDKVQKSALQYASGVAKNLGATYAQEVTEENLQNGVGIAMRGALAAMDEEIELNGSKELQQAFATNRQAMLAMPFMLAPGGAVQVAGAVAEKSQGSRDQRTGQVTQAAREWASSTDSEVVSGVAALAGDEPVTRKQFDQSAASGVRVGDRKLTQDERTAFVQQVRAVQQEGVQDVGPGIEQGDGGVVSSPSEIATPTGEKIDEQDSGPDVAGRPDPGRRRTGERGPTGMGERTVDVPGSPDSVGSDGTRGQTPGEVEAVWRATVPGADQQKFAPGKSQMIEEIQAQGEGDGTEVQGRSGISGDDDAQRTAGDQGRSGESEARGSGPLLGDDVGTADRDRPANSVLGDRTSPPQTEEATTETVVDDETPKRKLIGQRLPDAEAPGGTAGPVPGSVDDTLTTGKPKRLIGQRRPNVRTTTGREIPSPPVIRTDSNRKASNDLKKQNQWLIDQSVAEAKARGDDFNLIQFQNEKANNLPPASKAAMSQYLFDDPHAEFDAETGEQIRETEGTKPLIGQRKEPDAVGAPVIPAEKTLPQDPRELSSWLDIPEGIPLPVLNRDGTSFQISIPNKHEKDVTEKAQSRGLVVYGRGVGRKGIVDLSFRLEAQNAPVTPEPSQAASDAVSEPSEAERGVTASEQWKKDKVEELRRAQGEFERASYGTKKYDQLLKKRDRIEAELRGGYKPPDVKVDSVKGVPKLSEVSFDTIADYEETEGVGKNRGVRYRTAKYVLTNDAGEEVSFEVRVSSNGDRRIKELGKTQKQLDSERDAEYAAMPTWARNEVERLWPDLNSTQKRILAQMYAGEKVQSGSINAVLGGAARDVFQREFPSAATYQDAIDAMKEKGQALKSAEPSEAVGVETEQEGAKKGLKRVVPAVAPKKGLKRPGEQQGLPGLEEEVARANEREKRVFEFRKDPIHARLQELASRTTERSVLDSFGTPDMVEGSVTAEATRFADANMDVFEGIRTELESRVSSNKDLRDWTDVAQDARDQLELPESVDEDTYDELVSGYIDDLLPTLTDSIKDVKNDSGTFKIGDAVIDNETGEDGVIEKFAYNDDGKAIAVLESMRGRSQDEVPVEDLRVPQAPLDEAFQTDTREEWDTEIKRRLRERMGDVDYDNADIERQEGLAAIDAATSAGEDLGRDWYDSDAFRYLEEIAVEAMPEPTESEATTEVKTKEQQVEDIVGEPTADESDIRKQLERKGMYRDEAGVQHKIVPGEDMVGGEGTWSIELTDEGGKREVVQRGLESLESAQDATVERILNPPQGTTPITGVAHVVEYYDDKRNLISKRFKDLKKAQEYARKHESSVETRVPPVKEQKAKTVVKYNKKSDSFDVSALTYRQSQAVDDRLEKEASRYGGEDSPPNLLRNAVRARSKVTAPPAREQTDFDKRISEAYSGMQKAEGERGRHESEASRIVERRTKEIAKQYGVPAGRSHGSLSSAKKYKDAIANSRAEARNDPGVKEQKRLAEVASAEHAKWKDKLNAARKEAGEVQQKELRDSGDMLEPGTIIISNREGVNIAGRIEGWNTDKGEYDYTPGMFSPSSGTFQPTTYGGRIDTISHGAATGNFSTLDDYQTFEAVQQQAQDAMEAMRTERSRKAEVAKQKAADEDMRKRVTLESPVKTTVARVHTEPMYVAYGEQDMIGDGRFVVLESAAPANLKKRDKDLKDRGKLGRYGDPNNKAKAKEIVDNAGKKSKKLDFVAYIAAEGDSYDQAVLTDGSNTITIDADYYNFFSKAGFEFHGNTKAMTNDGAVALKKGDKLVGSVAPLSGDTPSIDAIQKVLGGNPIPTKAPSKAEEAPKKKPGLTTKGKKAPDANDETPTETAEATPTITEQPAPKIGRRKEPALGKPKDKSVDELVAERSEQSRKQARQHDVELEKQKQERADERYKEDQERLKLARPVVQALETVEPAKGGVRDEGGFATNRSSKIFQDVIDQKFSTEQLKEARLRLMSAGAPASVIEAVESAEPKRVVTEEKLAEEPKADVREQIVDDIARWEKGGNESLLSRSQRKLKAFDLAAKKGLTKIPYRHSTYGSNQWAVLDTETGEDASGLPQVIDHPDLGKTEGMGPKYFARKKDAQASIDEVLSQKESTEPTLPSKAIQNSITRAFQARDVFHGKVNKKQFENAYASLRTHASKLDIEVPSVGTYFHADAYIKAGDAVSMEIAKKYGGHPTQELRDKRDAVIAADNAVPEHIRIATKLAETLIGQYARNGYTTDPAGFRDKYSDMSIDSKMAVQKELGRMGLLNAVDTRKRKPMTGSELLDSINGQIKLRDIKEIPSTAPSKAEEAPKKKPGLTTKGKKAPDANDETPSNKLEEFTSPELQERQSLGAARMRITSAEDMVGDDEPASSSKYASDDKEFERRFARATKGVGKTTLGEKLKTFLDNIVKATIRGSLPELPRSKQFGEARSAMHAYQQSAQYAHFATKDLLAKTVKPLSAEDYDLFSRVVIMRDQAEAAERGETLSYGLTTDSVKHELKRVEELARDNSRVEAALEYRESWKEAMIDDYLSAHQYLGLDLSDRFDRENYFRHQVLYYMAAKDGSVTGKSKAELDTNRGWLKKRQKGGEDLGEEFDINANYLQAEWEVATQMIADTKRAQAIGRIKRAYDKLRALKSAAKRRNYEAVVGGEDVLKEIEGLRGQMAEIRAQGELDSGDRQMLKQLSERVWELDPTMPFRQKIAIARSQFERKAEDIDEDVGDDTLQYASEVAAKSEHPLQGPAAGMLKAISERNEFIKKELGDKHETWGDLVPDDHQEVAIRPGRAMFQAYTVPELVSSELLTGLADELGITAEDLKPISALGSKFTPIVVPVQVAAQMASIDNNMDFGWLDHLVTRPMAWWKKWRLQGPTSVIKYNLRNMSEVDKVMALNPDSLKYVAQAGSDLFKLYSGKSDLPANVRDWAERGGLSTLMRINELGDINDLKEFSRLAASKKQGLIRKTADAPAVAWRKYWETVGWGTDLREAMLRYASYLSYMDQLKKGKLSNYGGSVRGEVDGIVDNKDKAMRLSSDLLGDYSDISLVGQFLRSRVFPFWSFQETNFRTYFRGTMNLASNEQSAIKAGMAVAKSAGVGSLAKAPFMAYKLGRMAILFYGMKAALTAWNRLLFGDDDDELPQSVKSKAHITLGRNSNGEVLYFSRLGTAADVLDWFGLDAVDYDLRDVLDGRRTLAEVAQDYAYSPVNKLYQMISPFMKLPGELVTGQSAYPDVRKPGRIRDTTRHIANSLGLAREYDQLSDNPSRDYSLWDYSTYRVEPGSSVYYLTQDAKYRWLKTARNRGVGYSESARGEALRNYKMSVRFDDKNSADRYLAEYTALGGDEKGLLQSLAWAHPAGGLSAADAIEFYGSLSEVEKQEYGKAEQFYYSELVTEEQATKIRQHREGLAFYTISAKDYEGDPSEFLKKYEFLDGLRMLQHYWKDKVGKNTTTEAFKQHRRKLQRLFLGQQKLGERK